MNMKQQKQHPLLIAALAAAAVILAILLVWGLVHNASQPDKTADSTAAQQEESTTEASGSGEETEASGETSQPEASDQSQGTSTQDTSGSTVTVNPEDSEQVDSQAGVLPSDWDDLTDAQKTERNPLGCDLETQVVHAEDGSCHDKAPTMPAERSTFLRLDDSFDISKSPLRCHFFEETASHPDDDGFVWAECSILLKFKAMADINQSTIFSDHSYVYRMETTDADGNSCLGLKSEFVSFTFGRGETAETEPYFTHLSQQGPQASTECQVAHREGLSFSELKAGETRSIRFYIRGKTTAELKRGVSITIQSEPPVLLERVSVGLVRFTWPGDGQPTTPAP